MRNKKTEPMLCASTYRSAISFPAGTVGRISYHCISIAVVLGAIVFGLLRSPESCLRFWESLRDFFHSLFFGFTPTVTQLPHGIIEGFPKALEDLKALGSAFGVAFIAKENFYAYLAFVGELVSKFAYILAFGVLPVALVFGAVLLQGFVRNTKHGKKSKPLKMFLVVRQKIFSPAGAYLRGFFRFFRRRKKYFLTLVLTILFFMNVYTVVLEFFAFYFYILFADVASGFGTQVIKLLYDGYLAFRILPVWIWVIIGIFVFDRIRKGIGYKILEHYEQNMRDFLEDRGVNKLICGPPRAGKTTLLVSIAKTLMAVSREKAHDGMRDIERKFPDFPWITFEMILRKGYAARRFRTVYHTKKWLNFCITECRGDPEQRKRFLSYLNRFYRSCSEEPFKYPLFNYDTEHFKTVYRGGLGDQTIEDVLYDYAALYIIYIQPTLILSNFAIRSDDDWFDYGNFPQWRDDFFRHDPSPLAGSQFSHILNQDMIRPGKRVDPNCRYVDAYEFGYLIETEVGKERGNQFDREGKSASDPEANTLNDRRDEYFKLMGHLGTHYNIPFAGYVGDEQRPESWGANARELCDVIMIRKRCNDKIVMPFFALEQLVYLIVKALFGNFYDGVRANRGDTTLTIYFLAHVCKRIYDHYDYIKNKFGGHFLEVNVEMAMKQDGDTQSLTKSKLFVSNVKVYAGVFKTDAWKGVMEQKVADSKSGLEDVPCFKQIEAGLDEFLEMRSYFFAMLLKRYGGKKEEQEDALALILWLLKEFDLRGRREFGEDLTRSLIGEFSESIPGIIFKLENTKKEKYAALRKALMQKWDELMRKGRTEAEKAKAEAAKEQATPPRGAAGEWQ